MDNVWLIVSEIRLFTQPTCAPPPSRPPPPRPALVSKPETGSLGSTNPRKKASEFCSFHYSSQHFQSCKSVPGAVRSSHVSQIDGFEHFIMGRTQNNIEHEDVLSCGEMETNSAAAVMKEARGRAEAKFRHAEVARESENKNAARGREDVRLEKDEKSMEDAQERILREKQDRLGHEQQHREKEEQEREQQRHEEQRERECKEDREQRRLERERERTREIEKEREKARRAVERATREAHETAASEFCLKAQRAAVEKANAEAREHAERAAVQRAQAEAPERAAAEAKERAEKAVADARERASVQAKEKEAWENAAAEARERTAATARVNQRKNENDFESFFSTSNRPSREPRPRELFSENLSLKHVELYFCVECSMVNF